MTHPVAVSVTSLNDLTGLTNSQQLPGQASPNTFLYTYNRAGGLETETYPSNRLVKTCYDSAARIQSVAGGPTTYASGIQYAAHGAVSSMTLGDGLVESTTFNPRQQPTQIQAGSLLTLNYTYGTANNNGNVLTQAINDGTTTRNQTYGYDALNRLTNAVEGTTWSQTYVYDAYGNRGLLSTSNDPSTGVSQLLVAPTSSTTSVPFNANNHWNAAGVGYNDGRGNLTDVSVSPNSFHAVYDAENRLVSTTTTVGGTTTAVSYSYDGDGKRVSKVVTGGATTGYVYDALGNLIAEYSTVANPDTANPLYLTSDALGSTRLITTGTTTPAVSSRSDYLPFGQEIPTTWSRANYLPDPSETIKFTGKERDAETGLDYFGARYLSGAQGRFMSPDWSAKPQPVPYANLTNPQTLNLYSFVRNNPLSQADANGHCESLCAQIIVWASSRIAVSGPQQFAKDVGIGIAKGAGSFAFNALKPFAAASNPATFTTTMMTPKPNALVPSNQTQAPVATATDITLALAATVAPLAAGGAAASAGSSVATAAADTSSFVFWSGPGAQAAAEAFSAANNGTMIGMTEFGQAIENGTMTAAAASEAFANSASGTVQVFSNDPLTNYGNIWFNYELPALAKNPDVTNMVFNPVPKVP